MRLGRFTRHRPNDRTRIYNDNKNPNKNHRVIFVATNIQTRISSILGDVHRGRFDRVTANTTTPKSRRDQNRRGGTSRRQKPKTTKPKKSSRRFETSSERKNLAPSVLERRVRRGGDGLKRNRCASIQSSHEGNSYSSLLTFITAHFAEVYLHVLNVLLLFLFQNLLQFLFRHWKQKPILFGICIQNRGRRSLHQRKIRQRNHRRQGEQNEKHEYFPVDAFIRVRSLFVLVFHWT